LNIQELPDSQIEKAEIAFWSGFLFLRNENYEKSKN
jgi:hypothetical protein